MKLSLNRSRASKASWLDREVAKKLQKIAAGLGRSQDVIDLIVVDDEFIQDINLRYRGQDRPTDVISFSYADQDASPQCGETPADDDLAVPRVVKRRTKKYRWLSMPRQQLKRKCQNRKIDPKTLKASRAY